jgi:hypothetical protein
LLNQKILVSGCGISYSKQDKKVWTNILKVSGANIVDVGGPAVSNQWILDRAFIELLADTTITSAIIQLTSIGKLDIEINSERQIELVDNDSLRNFTVNGIWPSSYSVDHPAKELWTKWLHSPCLEIQELFCKIMLLSNWCESHDIKLLIVQGYDIAWTSMQLDYLKDKIHNLSSPIYTTYTNSTYYQQHDHQQQNTIPCLEYQFQIAVEVATLIMPSIIDKVNYVYQQHQKLFT